MGASLVSVSLYLSSLSLLGHITSKIEKRLLEHLGEPSLASPLPAVIFPPEERDEDWGASGMTKTRFTAADVRAMVRDLRSSVLGLRVANVYSLQDQKVGGTVVVAFYEYGVFVCVRQPCGSVRRE